MATTAKKQARAELDKTIEEAIERYLLANGPRVNALIQQSIDEARAESMAAENRARLALQEEWYGPPEPPPAGPAKVIAVKSFVHLGDTVELGSVWVADHQVVQSAPTAFAAVAED